MIVINAIKAWLNFMIRTAQDDNDIIILQSMINLIENKPKFFENQTNIFNLSKRYDVEKDIFVMRMLENAENLSPKECSIFDYMMRNMSQDNVICLKPKEDFIRLDISKTAYYRTLSDLESKNYICKISKEMIDTHTSKDTVYYMINPDKGTKRNMKGRNKLRGKYELIRKGRNLGPVEKCTKDTYHTTVNKIRVILDNENDSNDDKSLFFDVNTIMTDKKQNKKALANDTTSTSARTNPSINSISQSE